jgi:hypothetical protein
VGWGWGAVSVYGDVLHFFGDKGFAIRGDNAEQIDLRCEKVTLSATRIYSFSNPRRVAETVY